MFNGNPWLKHDSYYGKRKKLAEHLFFRLWEKSKGKGLFCLKCVLNSMLQPGICVHTEADLVVLIQHKLILRMTSENYMAFASLKNAYTGVFSPK